MRRTYWIWCMRRRVSLSFPSFYFFHCFSSLWLFSSFFLSFIFRFRLDDASIPLSPNFIEGSAQPSPLSLPSLLMCRYFFFLALCITFFHSLFTFHVVLSGYQLGGKYSCHGPGFCLALVGYPPYLRPETRYFDIPTTEQRAMHQSPQCSEMDRTRGRSDARFDAHHSSFGLGDIFGFL